MTTPTFDAFDTTLATGLEGSPRHVDADVFPGDIEWYRLLERHVLGASSSVRVHRATFGGASATLVLVRERIGPAGLGVRLRALQNYYTPDYRPVCSEGAARALIAPLVEHVVREERADLLTLSPLDPDAPETFGLRAAFAGLGWSVRESTATVNWRCSIDGDFESYLAGRPSRVRSTLRRRIRRWEALGGARIEVHDGRDDLGGLIERYRRVYDRSWKSAEPYEEFVPALIAHSAERGRLRLGLASIDGVPVAAQLWLVDGRCASIYKLAHDAARDRLSPGTVLMGAMLRHVIERDGVSRIDFLTGDDAYKRDWMNERREKLELRAYASRSAVGLAALAEDSGREAARRMLASSGARRLRRLVRRDPVIDPFLPGDSRTERVGRSKAPNDTR